MTTRPQTSRVPASPTPPSGDRSKDTKTLLALVLAVFSYALMQTVIVPALGLLERELDTTPTWSAWILSGFLLSSAVATPVLGRWGDLHGRRRCTLVVLLVYAAGMVAAAVSQDIGQLVAARVLQGVGLALVPLSFAIIREALPAERMSSATGLVSGVVGAGAGAGLVVGGLMADHVSWRYLFVLGAALALVSAFCVARWVPQDTPAGTGRIDLLGVGFLGVGLAALLLALTQGPSWGWSSTRTIGLFVLSALVLAALVPLERAVRDPLVDIDELTDRPMLITHIGAFLFGVGSYVFYLTLPLYAQQVPGVGGVGFGSTITVAGLLLLPGMLTIIPAGMAVGRLTGRFEPRWTLGAGFALGTIGALLFAVGHSQMWQHVAFYVAVGAGSGLVMGTLPVLIARIVPRERTGTANSINNIVRTVGGTVGSQVSAAVIASGVEIGGVPDRIFAALFWIATGTFLLGGVAAPFAVRRRGRPSRRDQGRPAPA